MKYFLVFYDLCGHHRQIVIAAQSMDDVFYYFCRHIRGAQIVHYCQIDFHRIRYIKEKKVKL